eukprot:m.180601 g.180601  ORF g.180601 m.180601 type:complete len:79 (+) comp18017_c0_seq4:1220-1456(+)
MHAKYIVDEQLLEVSEPELTSRVRAYTSNQDRTLMSAQSFLDGMFPGTSPNFIMHDKQSGVSNARVCCGTCSNGPFIS